MKNFKLPTFGLLIFTALFLQGCGDNEKRLDGQIIKTSDGRFFTIHHNIGDNYFVRPIDIDKAKIESEFILK